MKKLRVFVAVLTAILLWVAYIQYRTWVVVDQIAEHVVLESELRRLRPCGVESPDVRTYEAQKR